MRIGITERGDAGWNLCWHQTLKNSVSYDGAVLITKYITNPFIEAVMDLYGSGFPLVVHVTVTGWGGTFIEPGIHDYHTQLTNAKKLCDIGFPVKNLVIRVDPIWPTAGGLKKALEVIEEAKSINLLSDDGKMARMRISILDEYKHVKERIKAAGYKPIYGDRVYPPYEMIKNTAAMLKTAGIPFETCAEETLAKLYPGLAKIRGCVSETDLALMGLDAREIKNMCENMQHKSGCHCLSCKSELLNKKGQCPTKCIYCYWK